MISIFNKRLILVLLLVCVCFAVFAMSNSFNYQVDGYHLSATYVYIGTSKNYTLESISIKVTEDKQGYNVSASCSIPSSWFFESTRNLENDIINSTIVTKTAKSFKITYKDQGGQSFTGVHASGRPTIHTYDTATTLKTASKTGYTFGGWFTNSNCSGTAVTSLGAKGYTSDITLYAKWTANTYTITYKDGGGTNFSGTHESNYPTTHTYDTETLLKSASKPGYSFEGWFIDSECTTKVTSLEAKGYTSDITLYAKWDAIQKVDFDKEATSGVVFGLNLDSLGGTATRVDIITPSSVRDASGNRVSSTSIVSYTDLNNKDEELGLYVFKAETSPVNYDEQIIAKVYGNDMELLKKTSSPKDCALALVSDTDVNVSNQAKAYLMYCEAMKNLYYSESSSEFYNSYSDSFEAVEWDTVEDAVINKDTSIINDYSALDVKSSSDFEMNLGVSGKLSVEFLIKAKKIESGEYRRQDEFKVTVTDLGSATVTSGETLIGLSDVFKSGDVYYAIRIENIPVEELNQKYKFEITRTSRINPTKVVERYTGSFCALDFMKIYKSQNDSFIQAAEAMFLYNKLTKTN